jgi:hypothetical protein
MKQLPYPSVMIIVGAHHLSLPVLEKNYTYIPLPILYFQNGTCYQVALRVCLQGLHLKELKLVFFFHFSILTKVADKNDF